MKKNLCILLILPFFFACEKDGKEEKEIIDTSQNFIEIVVEPTKDYNQITILFTKGTGTVDWGDGSKSKFGSGEVYPMHEYKTIDKEFTIKIETTNLTEISIYGGSIDNLNHRVKKWKKVNINKCPKLTKLTIEKLSESESDINLTNCPLLQEARLVNIKTLTLGSGSMLEKITILESKLSTLNITQSSKLEWVTIEDCMNLTTLNITEKNSSLHILNLSNCNIPNLDLRNLTGLGSLYVKANLSEINLSANSKLYQLHILDCKLTKIDLSGNSKLELISLVKNKLTNIDLSANTSLKELYVSNNQLAKLDLSHNKEIESLYCASNQLSNITLPDNRLKLLFCENNLLEAEELNNLFSKLTPYNGVFRIINNPGETSCNIKLATDKGWKVFNEQP